HGAHLAGEADVRAAPAGRRQPRDRARAGLCGRRPFRRHRRRGTEGQTRLTRPSPPLGTHMARYLVTGAAGFIGSHVSAALLARGDEVVGVDDFNDFYDPRLKEENAATLLEEPGFSLVRGNLLDEAVRAACFEGPPVEA